MKILALVCLVFSLVFLLAAHSPGPPRREQAQRPVLTASAFASWRAA